jgi:hypothetical protein
MYVKLDYHSYYRVKQYWLSSNVSLEQVESEVIAFHMHMKPLK